jgi:hypothetical protein
LHEEKVQTREADIEALELQTEKDLAIAVQREEEATTREAELKEASARFLALETEVQARGIVT